MMMVSNLRCVQNNVINAFTAYTCITYHLHIFKCFDQFHGPVTPMCATGEGVTPMGQSSGITPTKICETPSAEWIFGDGSVRVGGTHLNTRGLFYYPLLRPSSPCHTHSIYRVRFSLGFRHRFDSFRTRLNSKWHSSWKKIHRSHHRLNGGGWGARGFRWHIFTSVGVNIQWRDLCNASSHHRFKQ